VKHCVHVTSVNYRQRRSKNMKSFFGNDSTVSRKKPRPIRIQTRLINRTSQEPIRIERGSFWNFRAPSSFFFFCSPLLTCPAPSTLVICCLRCQWQSGVSVLIVIGCKRSSLIQTPSFSLSLHSSSTSPTHAPPLQLPCFCLAHPTSHQL